MWYQKYRIDETPIASDGPVKPLLIDGGKRKDDIIKEREHFNCIYFIYIFCEWFLVLEPNVAKDIRAN